MVFKSNFPDVTPDPKYRDLVSNFFWHQLDEFSSRTLFLDYETGRQWTGGQIKSASARLALSLRRLGLAPGPGANCVLFYKHCDYIQLAALGILFAGGSVCVGFDSDPEHEHAYMLGAMQPAFVLVKRQLVAEMLRIRAHSSHQALRQFTLIVMDDDELAAPDLKLLVDEAAPGVRVLGLHHDLLAPTGADDGEAAQSQLLPVQVDPQQSAFVLLTSGSSGRPKPGCRSQRNSLYVAHSLLGAQDLWDLNESSVVAAHLALDHGTGIFQLKQCLARGFKCIIMNGYQQGPMLAAIREHAITDLVLGSALLHNLLDSAEVGALAAAGRLADHLGSLRNLLAVGSALAAQPSVADFMRSLPDCSVRQAYGMTECGFLCVVPRALALADSPPLDAQIVGRLLPNVELKLLERAQGQDQDQDQDQPTGPEIRRRNAPGELYVRGPTVSPGYFGEQFREQARASFLPDGFYKSNDICAVDEHDFLRVFGRFNEVLCLHDGWKVLPSEIEHEILEHPLVREVAVVGVAHPHLPGCHATRAYIVPKEGVRCDEPLAEVAAARGGAPVANGQAQGDGGEGGEGGGGGANSHLARADGQDAGARTLTSSAILEFVAGRLSGPKQLGGGVKFMRRLPKISLGKVDKKALKQMDGLM